jgi:hypothetical protein
MNLDRLDVPLIDYNQSMKDCKKTSPNYSEPNIKKGISQIGFKTGDLVSVIDNTKCIFNNIELNGTYKFNSYDQYDNGIYIEHKVTKFTYKVTLRDIVLI